MGELFEKIKDVNAALESYHKAVSVGLPDTASDAYHNIGYIYKQRRMYDKVRSMFNESLKIQENQSSPTMHLVAISHIELAEIEHWANHREKRDFHIEQALIIADSNEKNRDFIRKRISFILV